MSSTLTGAFAVLATRGIALAASLFVIVLQWELRESRTGVSPPYDVARRAPWLEWSRTGAVEAVPGVTIAPLAA